MRSLYVLRHGQAEAHSTTGEDHDRDLTERGRQAAASVGEFLARLGEVPELVLVSSAVRARRTVELAHAAGAWEAPVDVEPPLYLCAPQRVMQVVQGRDAEVERLLVAGHEPWCSELVALATGGAAPRFPPAGLARIDVHVDAWSQLAPARGILNWLVVPNLLEQLRD